MRNLKLAISIGISLHAIILSKYISVGFLATGHSHFSFGSMQRRAEIVYHRVKDEMVRFIPSSLMSECSKDDGCPFILSMYDYPLIILTQSRSYKALQTNSMNSMTAHMQHNHFLRCSGAIAHNRGLYVDNRQRFKSTFLA